MLRAQSIRQAPRQAAAGGGERRLPYRPALDGIRALAVAGVLAYHADLPFARGGFLGVDAFFVLSGYLITSLLLAEWQARGTIDLPAFWARRARRLLPALFLVLVAVGGYALLFAEPGQLDKLRGDALATLGYFANWRFAFSGDSYFEQFALPSPLRHTWSLAIEEQWYLVWPLLLVLLLSWRRGSLRALLGLAVAMTVGSALLMALLHDPRADPSRVYYGTDTRAHSLLVGAVLAMLLLRGGAIRGAAQGLLQVAAVGCAAYVGWLWVTTPESSAFLYNGGYLVAALAVAVVITAAVQPQAGPLGKLLSLGPLRGLGLISYGVYLWHWPIYLVLTPERTGLDGAGLVAARVGITLLVSVASYHMVEMPMRQGALRAWRTSWALAPAAATVLVVGLVVATWGGRQSIALPPDALRASLSGAASSALASAPGAGDGVAPTRVLVVGDSVAYTMTAGLYPRQEELGFTLRDATIIECGIVRGDVKRGDVVRAPSGDCRERMQRWVDELWQFRPDVVLLQSGLWDAKDHEVDGRMIEFGTPEGDDYWLSEMQTALDLLSLGGAKVAIVSALYFPEESLAPESTDRLNMLYREVACRNPDSATFLDLNGFLYPTGELIPFIDGMNVRGDGYHFSPEGADMVGRWLASRLSDIARGEGGGAMAAGVVAGPCGGSGPLDGTGGHLVAGTNTPLAAD
jgi:peptidoglycan/LPS O-acetylase OafA/YrhL